jgi:hypothetical protein
VAGGDVFLAGIAEGGDDREYHLTSKNGCRGRPARKLLLGSRSGGRSSGTSGRSSGTSGRNSSTFDARERSSGGFGSGFFGGHFGADHNDTSWVARESDASRSLEGADVDGFVDLQFGHVDFDELREILR